MPHRSWGDMIDHDVKVKQRDNWNKLVPLGTPVRYYPVRDRDEYRETTTRSEAWILNEDHPSRKVVIMIANQAGCVALSHLEVIE